MEQTIVGVSPDETAVEAAARREGAAGGPADDMEQTPSPLSQQHPRSRILCIDDLGRLTVILRGGREVRACVVRAALPFGRG